MKKFLVLGLCCFTTANAVSAQSVTSVVAPTLPALQPLSGTGTLNQTVSTGSKASLSFGSSTSFGASANLNGTSATTTQVKSRVKLKDLDIANEDSTANITSSNLGCPTGNCISTRLGEKSEDGVTSVGVIDAQISNLRANNQTDQNSEDSNYTNGTALLGGVQASNDLVLDGLESDFSVATRTIHLDSTTDQSDPDTIIRVGNDTDDYRFENQLSQGAASAVVNSQTTVDINTNQFVSTFQQAY
jgi:hypothetical protein